MLGYVILQKKMGDIKSYFALGAWLQHFGYEWDDVEELLLSFVVGFDDEGLHVQVQHQDGDVAGQGHQAQPVAQIFQKRTVTETTKLHIKLR